MYVYVRTWGTEITINNSITYVILKLFWQYKLLTALIYPMQSNQTAQVTIWSNFYGFCPSYLLVMSHHPLFWPLCLQINFSGHTHACTSLWIKDTIHLTLSNKNALCSPERIMLIQFISERGHSYLVQECIT